MAFNRWEWLEGLTPESAITVAVKHMAKLIADELSNWPPEVSDLDGKQPSRFGEILTPGAPRPPLSSFEEAVKRVRWELTRNYDAIDFYERNHFLQKACPDIRDQLASEFIQHYILEAYFVLMERTDYRVKRTDALRGVDLLERHITSRWSVVETSN